MNEQMNRDRDKMEANGGPLCALSGKQSTGAGKIASIALKVSLGQHVICGNAPACPTNVNTQFEVFFKVCPRHQTLIRLSLNNGDMLPFIASVECRL